MNWLKRIFRGKPVGNRADEAMAGAVRQFLWGIVAATVALAWFAAPTRLLARWANQLAMGVYQIEYAVGSGDETEAADGLGGLLGQMEIGAVGDDLIPEGPAKLALAVLVLGTVLLIGETAGRRKGGRMAGLVHQIAGTVALAGNLANVWTWTSAWWKTGLCALVVCLGLELGLGIHEAFRPELRRWFGRGEDAIDPLAPFRSWGHVLLWGAAALALFLGIRVLGVSRDIGICTRDSLTGNGQVLVVQNRAEGEVLCAIEIGDDYCERFTLGGEPKEFGIRETGRPVKAGTTGRLSIQGHRRAIRFRVTEDKSLLYSGKWYHSVGKSGAAGYSFPDEAPIAFGQKPSRVGGAGGAVLTVKNTSRKETVRGTLTVNGGTASAELKLAPGEEKSFGMLELHTVLREGDKAEVSLVGYLGASVHEVGNVRLMVAAGE